MPPPFSARDFISGSSPAWASPDDSAALYLGDALDLLARVPDESVDCVWTDPPYVLSNDGITCVAGRMVSVNKGEWDRSQGLDADHDFNLRWTAECHRVLKPPARYGCRGRFMSIPAWAWRCGGTAVRPPPIIRRTYGRAYKAKRRA